MKTTTKLQSGHKHILRLIDKDQNENGWTSVSNILYPYLSKNMPRELVTFDGTEDNYRAKLTDEGISVVHAMVYL